jgi:VWFA-related protein
MRPFRRSLSAALIGAAVPALGTVAAAQDDQEPQDRFEGKVDVREVLLDVLVTDRKGNVIVGLGEDDFVVKEDGKPIDLTGVTFYSNSRLVESTEDIERKGLAIDRVPEFRYFILLFEDQKTKAIDAPQLLTQQIQAGRQVRDWIRTGMLPSDWVAIASYDSKLVLQQDFTHDKQALLDAIDKAIRSKDQGKSWPSRAKPVGTDAPSLAAHLPTGNALRDKTTTIYDGLQVLADAAGQVTGRKNLLLFTPGFGRVNDFGLYTPDPRYYPPTMQALNDNNVAVYPIDLWPAGTVHELANAMNKLALDTGGTYYFNFTSFATPLKQVSDENNGYYLLSYSARHPADRSGFQKVEVTTTNPEFRVRAREGYEYGDEG